MKFPYLTGEVGNIGISRIKNRVIGASAWWDIVVGHCVAAYSPWGAASYAASKINLVNPGVHDAVNGAVVPNWTSNGWTQVGGGYLLTDITPPIFPAAWSMMAYFDGALASGGTSAIAGMLSTVPSFAGFYFVNRASATANGYANGSFTNINGNQITGTMAVAGANAYRDGLPVGVIPAATYNPALALDIMGRNTGGSHTAQFSGTLKRLVIYDVTLSAPQIAALDVSIRII